MINDEIDIRRVYDRFSVPPNLAEHMETVAQVVRVIRDHWQGEPIDWDFIIQAALLHDIGNIVKFDFEAHPEFLREEQANIDHWKAVQRDIIARYGKDDHLASGNMLRELGVSDPEFTPQLGHPVIRKISFVSILHHFRLPLHTRSDSRGSSSVFC